MFQYNQHRNRFWFSCAHTISHANVVFAEPVYRIMKVLSKIWWWGYCSPPLAYSIIRYKVFSVSITSNNWTATKKETVTPNPTKLDSHHIHRQVDRFIFWMATHLCLDDSEFSWCVPLETTKKQNSKNEWSNSITRELLMLEEADTDSITLDIYRLNIVSQANWNFSWFLQFWLYIFTSPVSLYFHTPSDMMPFLLSWPLWGQVAQPDRGTVPWGQATHPSDCRFRSFAPSLKEFSK